MIIDYVSGHVRKLTVTLSWNEGFGEKRDLKVVTFITSLPESEVELQKAKDGVQEELEGIIPGLDGESDGTTPTVNPLEKDTNTSKKSTNKKKDNR
jgi:hypothetical protein